MSSAEKKTKPRLSTKMIRDRLAFTNRHKYWTVNNWKRMIWSEETEINRFCSDGCSWYWKRDEVGLQSHHVKQTIEYGGGSIMVWGCMTVHGPGFLCKIDGLMDRWTKSYIHPFYKMKCYVRSIGMVWDGSQKSHFSA
jgi:hypothetical protein